MVDRFATTATARSNSFMSWCAVCFPGCILALGSSSVNPLIKQEDYQVVFRQAFSHYGGKSAASTPVSRADGHTYPFHMLCRSEGIDSQVVSDQLRVVERSHLLQSLGCLSEILLNELLGVMQVMFGV